MLKNEPLDFCKVMIVYIVAYKTVIWNSLIEIIPSYRVIIIIAVFHPSIAIALLLIDSSSHHLRLDIHNEK